MRADSITFSLLPSDGNISGPAGSLVGWGYSITNNSSSDWFLATDLQADSFSDGTPTSLFDFPEVAPGATVTETLDPIDGIGLYELQWDLSAPVGTVDSGDFDLSGQWYDGDPFNGGNFIATAPDLSLAYAATVTGGTMTPVPEPGTAAFLIGASVVLLLVKIRFPGGRGLVSLKCNIFFCSLRPS